MPVIRKLVDHEPSYGQSNAVRAINNRLADLESAIRSAGISDMAVIGALRTAVEMAIARVLEAGR